MGGERTRLSIQLSDISSGTLWLPRLDSRRVLRLSGDQGELTRIGRSGPMHIGT